MNLNDAFYYLENAKIDIDNAISPYGRTLRGLLTEIYDLGYSDGSEQSVEECDCDNVFEEGYDEGYNSGYDTKSDESYEQGYNDGYNACLEDYDL